jgi:hypothetical protein
MIRFVKNLEIVIMLLAAWGFLTGSVPVLLLHLPDGAALHAVRAGEVRLPAAVLGERELTGGNGMVEMGTFVAILLGNVVGGLLWRSPRPGTATWPRLRGWWPVMGRGGAGSCRARRPPTRAGHQLEPVHRDLAQPEAGASATSWCSARCWASAGCGSSARCS